ncbi:hypothetical protein BSL78_17004 [Apostichopus japonicus]|uniref:NEDD4-binding protein 2-like 2 n=1 Tax=Stichopus japonicus TaxID=307972 RepID=A0A2G8KDP9_STIJA|nr:hypothetical protein BSL78_17004 [Apostichopus japonicus]
MQYTNSDVNSPQGTQDYLSTYYDPRSVTQGYYNPEHRQRTTYADLNIGVQQRTAPYNSYSRTFLSHGKENVPSWPKKQSQLVRTEKPKPQNLERHVEPLPRGNVLCLLRGLPGSGKTTLARELLTSARTGVIISTDDFFMKRDGTYEFNPFKLDEAHQSTQRKAKRAMENGITPVIIDNTNTQLWEMQPYAAMAVTMNYHVEVREPMTPWREKVGELARRKHHGVPHDKISRMLQRFERLDSLATLLQSTQSAGKKRTEPHHEHELGEGNANYKSPQRMTSKTKETPVSVRRVTKDQAVRKASDKQHIGHTTQAGSNKALPQTRIVKETVFAEKDDSQCTNVPLEDTQRSGSMDKVNNTKQKNVKDTRRRKGTPAAVNPETEREESEGSRVNRLTSSSSLHSTNTSPGNNTAYRARDGTLDDGNTSSGNTECFQSLAYLPAKFSSETDAHGVAGINVDHRSTTTTVLGNNQLQTLGSEWEGAGARPKVKRTISEPVVPVASEDPGILVNSPIRASDMQFRSLETVPRTKKRIRRAATPFARRSLAPTFSAPELPTLPESLSSKGEVAGDDKDKDTCISPLLSGPYQ